MGGASGKARVCPCFVVGHELKDVFNFVQLNKLQPGFFFFIFLFFYFFYFFSFFFFFLIFILL